MRLMRDSLSCETDRNVQGNYILVKVECTHPACETFGLVATFACLPMLLHDLRRRVRRQVDLFWPINASSESNTNCSNA